jgi:hypothetical protein
MTSRAAILERTPAAQTFVPGDSAFRSHPSLLLKASQLIFGLRFNALKLWDLETVNEAAADDKLSVRIW